MMKKIRMMSLHVILNEARRSGRSEESRRYYKRLMVYHDLRDSSLRSYCIRNMNSIQNDMHIRLKEPDG
jgi:hypothetical protein